LAFPNSEYLPIIAPELTQRAAIASGVAKTFHLPVGGIGRRRDASMATRVQMPEASVHIDDFS
jgi:hypothetical protein